LLQLQQSLLLLSVEEAPRLKNTKITAYSAATLTPESLPALHQHTTINCANLHGASLPDWMSSSSTSLAVLAHWRKTLRLLVLLLLLDCTPSCTVLLAQPCLSPEGCHSAVDVMQQHLPQCRSLVQVSSLQVAPQPLQQT
jgi:hypothetical protein